MPSDDSEHNAKSKKTLTFASILIFNRLQVLRAALQSTHVISTCVLSRTFKSFLASVVFCGKNKNNI
jgi:hypothetical protein